MVGHIRTQDAKTYRPMRVRLGLNIFKIPSGEITFILDGGAFLHYKFHP